MGVKSLWQLLTPVGRPVMLETVEGKVMAIDSSIWIYQFQATMRDRDGRALVNAHLVGFLRRICKLLFYGIKPVFVFDGGAPALKRNTISERKQKKSGAAASHAKIAEKLLAAHLRREAVSQAQANRPSSTSHKGAPSGTVIIDENAVYLEDVEATAPKTPKKSPKEKAAERSSSSKKTRFHDHDPYRLPDVDLEEKVAQASRSAAPDPRLATEEELRAFIEEMRPEDIDVTSPAFRELPTEVQYEIVGDLRLKSRQTSYKRLQNMLKNAPTPLDFSRQQILNLKQRNALTQQLLVTTNTIGQAHVSIPIRIASERNKEYLLVKNEGEGGGWILGIRDEGTQDKPIEIDLEKKVTVDDEESDMEMEEVQIPQPGIDPDLREYRQGLALNAISQRSEKSARRGKPKTNPLFEFDADEDDPFLAKVAAADDESEDEVGLAYAIAQSMEDGPSTEVAVTNSSTYSPIASSSGQRRHSSNTASPSKATVFAPAIASRTSSGDSEVSPTRLETALAIAGAGPARRMLLQTPPQPLRFDPPSSLLVSSSSQERKAAPIDAERRSPSADSEMEEVSISGTDMLIVEDASRSMQNKVPIMASVSWVDPVLAPVEAFNDESDQDMEDVTPVISNGTSGDYPSHDLDAIQLHDDDFVPVQQNHHTGAEDLLSAPGTSSLAQVSLSDEDSDDLYAKAPTEVDSYADHLREDEGCDDEKLSDWSRSSSPTAVAMAEDDSHNQDWDAAQEMDPEAEEGEFARFMSQVKGRDLASVRREIDDEIKSLNMQKRAAMRDSEDITQQMISQIMLMLRLFGIPYITAPLEAEAQCAELVVLGLVEGIITDDSDVFLFGGLRVYKNMFNQSKTVECFLLSDLARELGLERDTLIRLAYLLGSDYVDGLPGVGPVVAMELLKEFPGEAGLHKFKDWWSKVQTGKDKPEDNQSKFRRRFKKRFKNLYLPPEWPNPAVRDAYYHPTVDSSEEPFKWGMPDLDALRQFLQQELGWGQTKVDELLLPIIQKMNRRGQAAALNKQGNLNEYLDVTAGSGTHAPRRRQAYASKRLQQVVSDFRIEQAKRKGRMSSSPALGSQTTQEDEDDGPAAKKSRTGARKGKGKERAGSTGALTAKTSGKTKGGRKTQTTSRASKKKNVTKGRDEEEESDSAEAAPTASPPPPLAVELRPRPKPRPVIRKKFEDKGTSTDSHD